MTAYERILRAREDMTDWVIHFTRPDEVNGLSARDRLLQIAIEGVLRPGWSVRPSQQGPRTTIYGQQPVVCFTEQPLSAFHAYVSVRNDREHLSGYGVLVHKRDLFAEGGLPVIYDTVSELGFNDAGYVAGYRMLWNRPLDQQYRYVAFNPNAAPYPIDWSHEREWRWAERILPVPSTLGGFPLAGTFLASNTGMSDGRAHLIVEREADVDWLRAGIQQYIASQLRPRGDFSHQGRWQRALQKKVGVISLERVSAGLQDGRREYGRLETWPDYVPLAGEPRAEHPGFILK